MRPYVARIFFFAAFSVICSCNTLDENGDASIEPEISLPQGNIKGFNIVTSRKRVISAFTGIPFAQPPIGNLRFRAPLAAVGWNGTLNATKTTNVCVQVDKNGTVIGKEDCLYLNVYTPQLPGSTGAKPMPVMVWIHSGAFHVGTGDFISANPKYILDKDVVLVAPNFRLGPLGFLSTGDEVSPGNYGLKDQVLALKWVQTNAKYFGGDPNQVTVFGRSSGAASANLLALSDSTIGLFHRYIKMSGSAFSPRAYVPRAILARDSYLLGNHLGCLHTTSTDLINCLRQLNAGQITDTAVSIFRKWDIYPDIIWRPTDEPDIEGAFLTDSPANLYAARKIRNLPCISGVVRDEGLYYVAHLYKNPDLFDDFLNKVDGLLPHILLYQDHDDVQAHTAAIKAYYLNDLTAERNVLLANLTQLFGDVFYIYPLYSTKKLQSALGKSPQYLYSFEYLRTFKYSYDTPIPKGIQHSDDGPFLFPINPSLCETGFLNCKLSEADVNIIDIMVDLWTSFAINGTPTLGSDKAAVNWESFSTDDNYLRIGNGSDLSLEMKHSFLKERMQFWAKLLTDPSSKTKSDTRPSSCTSDDLWIDITKLAPLILQCPRAKLKP